MNGFIRGGTTASTALPTYAVTINFEYFKLDCLPPINFKIIIIFAKRGNQLALKNSLASLLGDQMTVSWLSLIFQFKK